MVLVALLVATTPIVPALEAQTVEKDEPPQHIELNVDQILAAAPTTLSVIEIGKSLADEQLEREKAEKSAQIAKIKAEKEAERIKHLAARESLNTERSGQEYVKIIGKSREQCVIYAKRVTGNAKIRGYAGDLVPEGHEPRVGALALEKDYGHVSVVVAIEGEWLILHDANWEPGYVTERRVHVSTQRGYIY